jgi:polyferredoxin
MKIRTARRIAQVFFLALFAGLCVVASVGAAPWQWRGWPINAFLQFDPLVAVGTALSTRSLHPGLAWALVTIAVTLLLGRVFCGWVCPFGTLHQVLGWVGRLRSRPREKIAANAFRPAQRIKYYLLFAMLAAASGNLAASLLRDARGQPGWAVAATGAACAVVLFLGLRRLFARPSTAALLTVFLVGLGALLAGRLSADRAIVASLQTGLLDPIPLLHRSFTVVVLPLLDSAFGRLWSAPRHYEGAWLIAALFLGFLALNLWIPRFYCRFLCPLGALLGVLARPTLWAIGVKESLCTDCSSCDRNCEGACTPTGPLRLSECLMCMNCLEDCPSSRTIHYAHRPSPSGEDTAHGVTRRGFLLSVAGGLAAAPALRLGGLVGPSWPALLVRPPGAVAEEEFLARCIKCDQCLRVCPTNVLQPAGPWAGLEAFWTPVLNMRIGTSGCQVNCVACGNACPTGAIRPITLDEKHGKGDFAARGPVRLGTAFVDPGRCLPWSMNKPCIVCEENCPTTPKAIWVDEAYRAVRDGAFAVASAEGDLLRLAAAKLAPGRWATGDYFARAENDPAPRRILANTADALTLAPAPAGKKPAPPPARVELVVRLQRPVVEPERCIGCGICEHECPVSGLRAIRVTAEGETRSAARSLLAGR